MDMFEKHEMNVIAFREQEMYVLAISSTCPQYTCVDATCNYVDYEDIPIS